MPDVLTVVTGDKIQSPSREHSPPPKVTRVYQSESRQTASAAPGIPCPAHIDNLCDPHSFNTLSP